MASVSISRFFQQLGAPLANAQWSWGAVRASDGTVFLKVWQDMKFLADGTAYHLVDGRGEDKRTSHGYAERLQHLERIRKGAKCFLVMCEAAAVDAETREVKDFNDGEVFAGGELVETPAGFEFPGNTAAHVARLTSSGATWIERGARRPAASV